MTTAYANAPEEAIVRIWSGDDDRYLVGVGFLVEDDLIITCAHVLQRVPVKNAAGLKCQVTVEFVCSAEGKRVTASVEPRETDHGDANKRAARDDIAALRLTGPAPSGAHGRSKIDLG